MDAKVKLNGSRELEIEDCEVDDLATAIFADLSSIDNKERRRLGQYPNAERLQEINEKAHFLVDLNAQGSLRLPIKAFGYGTQTLPETVVNVVIASCPLAKSLMAILAERNVPSQILDQLKNPHGVRWYLSAYHRLIAGFAMSITGVKDWGDLDANNVFDLLSAYTIPDGSSFRRRDLWGTRFDTAGRFLREIARVFGQIFTSSRISNLYRAKRRVVPGSINYRDIASEKFRNPPPHLVGWLNLYQEWRKSVKAISKAPKYAMGRLLLWLDTDFMKSEVEDARSFLIKKRSAKFTLFIARIRAENGTDEYSSSIQNELSELQRFSYFIAEYMGLIDCGSRIFPLVSQSELDEYTDGVLKSGKVNNSGEGSSNPLPTLLYALFQELLQEGENGWPGRHKLCRFFAEGQERYCPVLPSLFLLSFELPGRFGQLANLDSGEGDLLRFDGISLRWGDNTSRHSGYWSSNGVSTPRGYARQTRNPSITGFYFNTNKTGSPFVVPWQNAEAHKICQTVLDFVERWVPIYRPLAPVVYRDDLRRSDDGYLDKLDDIFPLFRMPAIASQIAGSPPSYNLRRDFWLDCMLEVQSRYYAMVPPEAALYFVELDRAGRPFKCEYMPHGMRTAGISRLLREGVSIAFISKLLVGHASILMTDRYNKHDPADAHGILEGNRLARTPQMGNLSQSMSRMSFEEARRRTVSGSEAALQNAFTTRGTWVERDVGLCPWLGRRCGDGGECTRRDIRNGVDKSLYKRLEDGSCLLCRHLITDASYIEGIYAKIEVLTRKLTVIIRRYKDISKQLFELEKIGASETSSNGVETKLDQQRRKFEVDLNDITQSQTNISEMIANGQRYIEQLRILEGLNDNSQVSDRKIVHRDNALSEWDAANRQDQWVLVSDFEQLTRIMHKSTFFTSVYDAEVEASFKLTLDQMIIESGFRPISLNQRTKEEQRKDYLRASRMIMNKISRQELMAMEDGIVTPNELGFGEVLKSLKLRRLSAPTAKKKTVSASAAKSLTAV
ncbi:MAG: VPA1269 family protein [Allorhizobium sp.]